MNEEDKNKIKAYSKQTPLYLSRRKFDSEGVLTAVKCPGCKSFKSVKDYAKNKVQIDGIEIKCKLCKAKK